MVSAAAAAVAAAPVVVSVIHALGARWVPFGDRAIIAVRAYDVFSPHSPLVGQYSVSSASSGQSTHSLGPMLYWLLALPSRLLGGFGTPVTMGLVNVACVVGAVFLARRRGGLALMLASAVAIVLMCRSLPAEVFHDSWNPSAGVLPLLLLFFLCWSLACGEYRFLPLTAIVASFVAQAHLTFAPPGLGALLVGLGGLAIMRGWLPGRRTRRTAAAGGNAAPWVLGAALAALICWSGPILDQAIHRPGNFAAVARSIGRGPSVGWRIGWHALVRAVGVPPWWLTARRSVGDRLVDVFHAPGVFSDLTAVLLLIALAALTVEGWRRRQPSMVAAPVLAIALCLALATVTASTPTEHLLWMTLGYTLWWGSPAGMWIWLVLGWGYGTLIARRISVPVAWQARLAAVVLVPAALIAAAVALAEGPDLNQVEYRPIRALVSAVLQRVPAHETVRIDRTALSDPAYNYEAALLYALRRHGDHVVSPDLAVLLSAGYAPGAAQARIVLHLGQTTLGGPAASDSGARVIAQVSDGSGSRLIVTQLG